MGYYRGDGTNYYRGDYYRGDPFLGGLIAGAAKKLGGRALRWAGRQIRGSARDAVPAAIAGATGYAMGRGAGPMMTIPDLGPMEPGTSVVVGGGARGIVRGKPRVVKMYPSRRMNPLNPKALRRALRRAEGFEKFAARTVNSLYKVIDGRKVRTYKKRTRSS